MFIVPILKTRLSLKMDATKLATNPLSAPQRLVQGVVITVAELLLFSPSAHAQFIDLEALDGIDGVYLSGEPFRSVGASVSSAGDINDDGIDDFVIGGPSTNAAIYPGAAFVVFGSTQGLPLNTDLTTLDGTNGFQLRGVNSGDFVGQSVSGAGDVNGDGVDDLLLGAPMNVGYDGEAYIVFGTPGGFPALFELSSLDGSNGFVVQGVDVDDAFGGHLGQSVSGAGDFNGDGLADIVLGAYTADPDGLTRAGESYVVFGSLTGFPPRLNLTDLDGANGFALSGVAANDQSGYSVSGAGDVNGDGIDDIVLGAPGAGETYVVFGSREGFSPRVSLADLDGTNGFTLFGRAYAESGSSVSGAGDVNGDGLADLIIGAPEADTFSINAAGASYVVFGSTGGHLPRYALSELDGSNGFVLSGTDAGDRTGRAVAGIGDINGDGLADIATGSRDFLGPGDVNFTGAVYVIFGSRDPFSSRLLLTNLDGTNGFVINGDQPNGEAGSALGAAGDVNGDGIADLVIGSDNTFGGNGMSYLVFGTDNDFPFSVGARVSGVLATAGKLCTRVSPLERRRETEIHENSWSCEALGLELNGGDEVRTTAGSVAVDPLSVGGVVFGFDDSTPARVACLNRANGDEITLTVQSGVPWRCVGPNFSVKEGDRIRFWISGRKN